MKIKIIAYLIFLGLTTISAFGQAQLGPHKWTVTLKMTNEDGKPVKNAQVWVAYDSPKEGQSTDPFKANDWAIAGLTDSNGIFAASHTDRTWDLGIQIQKAGYYPSHINYELYVPGQFDAQKVATNRNPKLTLVLKRIGKPIPMYARQKEEGMVLQKENEPMGFDLKVGDWVTPYGTGFHTDIIFTLLHRQIISRHEFDCTLKASFPNKGDGICIAPPEEFSGSAFRTSRTAAENGYEPELILHFINTELATNVFGYFLRVETSLDENGNIKSAFYGKINGNFKLYAGTIKPHSGMGFEYYLNPTPNDHNLEFDPKRNLSRDLKLLERVNEP